MGSGPSGHENFSTDAGRPCDKFRIQTVVAPGRKLEEGTTTGKTINAWLRRNDAAAQPQLESFRGAGLCHYDVNGIPGHWLVYVVHQHLHEQLE